MVFERNLELSIRWVKGNIIGRMTHLAKGRDGTAHQKHGPKVIIIHARVVVSSTARTAERFKGQTSHTLNALVGQRLKKKKIHPEKKSLLGVCIGRRV